MSDFVICFGGDIVPTEVNIEAFSRGDVDRLIDKDLQEILMGSDANIFNLETPLCDELSPIVKCGRNLHAPSACINGLQAMHVTALGCANNHTLDQGEEAMFHTKSLCNEYNIDIFGIGKNLIEASKPYIIEKDGIKVGIYACAEHEFTIATVEKAGANPYDALYSFDHVAELKTTCNYVIVMFHGGKEYYRYPSPDIQRICRRFVEKGADLVVTQHTHCIGCREDYRNGVIIYGQGNFLFEQGASCNKDFYASGLLIKFKVGEQNSIEEIPVILQENGRLYIANDEEKEAILTAYNNRSLEIKSSAFVYEKYSNFAMSHIEEYLRIPLGYLNASIILRIINRMTGRKMFMGLTNRKHRLSILNIIECEAHRELFICGLKKLLEFTKR